MAAIAFESLESSQRKTRNLYWSRSGIGAESGHPASARKQAASVGSVAAMQMFDVDDGSMLHTFDDRIVKCRWQPSSQFRKR